MRFVALLLCLVAFNANAAFTYFGQASAPADNSPQDTSAARAVTPPASMVTGDLVFFVAATNEASGTIAISAAGGQTWTSLTALGSPKLRAFWAVYDGTWDTDPSIALTPGGTTAMTVYLTVFRPSSGSCTIAQDVAQSGGSFTAPSTPFDNIVAGQTPTAGASTVSIAYWMSTDDNTWALQTGTWTNPGSTTQIRNTTGVDQAVSIAYLIQGAASATGDVTNRQTANGGDAGASGMITFAESCGTPGKQSITLASIGTGSPCEAFNAAYNPDIVAGDRLDVDTTTDPGGFAVSVGTDCQYSYTGDGSRQYVSTDVYDTSAVGFHAQDLNIYFNNVAPVCGSPLDLSPVVGEAITAIVLANTSGSACTDEEGDTLSVSLTSGSLPTGITLSTATISGTATVADQDLTTVYTVTDLAGDTATQTITWATYDALSFTYVNVTSTVDGYQIDATFTQDGTVCFIAVRTNESTPTAAQIVAGQGADSTSADAAACVTATGSDLETLNLTGLTLPKYNIHGVGYVNPSYSDINTITGRQKLPAAGRTYTPADTSP